MSMSAIETRYAGCRFRSRLEARWAVLFDHLGVQWDYEPQGYNVTNRITLEQGTFGYLPDFFLPDHGLWVEVKGSLTWPETVRLVNAAASLSSNDGGGCHDSGGYDVVVLGPLPKPLRAIRPALLHMHKGDLQISAWDFEGETDCRHIGSYTLASDDGHISRLATQLLTEGCRSSLLSPRWEAAISAARSARFEHGERG